MSEIDSVLFLTVTGASTAAATTEQLRQWIMANRKTVPTNIEETPSAVPGSSSDLASTILRIFGFGPDKTTTTTTPATTVAITTQTVPRAGVKVSERDG